MLLKQHLDMIGRNEPIQRKARFWQSYVRALKDEPEYLAADAWDAHEKRLDAIDELLPMKYRYPHFYRPSSYRSASVPPPPRCASVPPLNLRALSRARSITPAPPHLRDYTEEKNPDNSLYSYTGNILPSDYSFSTPYHSTTFYSYAGNVLSSYLTNYLVYKHLHYYNVPGQKLNESSSSLQSSYSKAVTSYSSAASSSSQKVITKRETSYIPIRSTRINSDIIHAYLAHNDAYNWPGEPLYHRPYFGSYVRRPLSELLEPSTYLPRSRITRDPWWWDYPTLRPYSPYHRYPYTSLRYPMSPYWRSPYYLRDSYLSPIKRTYLWSYHPVRPFSYNYYWI